MSVFVVLKHYYQMLSLVELCEGFAKQSGARITVTDDIDKAVKGVDFVHTDVWVSMGEPLETWGRSYPIIITLPSDSRVNETHW